MNVRELLTHLTNYAAQSPQNGQAEVMMQYFDEVVYAIAGANDAKGMSGEHLLILVPDVKNRIGVKPLNVQ